MLCFDIEPEKGLVNGKRRWKKRIFQISFLISEILEFQKVLKNSHTHSGNVCNCEHMLTVANQIMSYFQAKPKYSVYRF